MSLPIFNFTKIESTNDFARSLITEHKIFKGIIIKSSNENVYFKTIDFIFNKQFSLPVARVSRNRTQTHGLKIAFLKTFWMQFYPR